MKLIRVLLISGMFIIPSLIFAQKNAPSGYLGKRFFVGVQFNYCPNIAGIFNSDALINYNNESKFYMLNPIRSGLSVGIVTGDYRSIVLDMNYQKMGVAGNLNYTTYPNAPLLDYDFATASVTTFGLHILANRGHCAPVGMYGGPTLLLALINTEAKTNSGKSLETGQLIDFGMGLNGGFRRVFKDKFMIDLGLSYNLLVHSFKYYGEDNYGIDYNTNIHMRALKKNAWNNTIPCKIAFYYLL